MPVTGSGKVLKRELQASWTAGTLAGEAAAPEPSLPAVGEGLPTAPHATYAIQWRAVEPTPADASGVGRRWLVLADERDQLALDLAAALRRRSGVPVQIMHAGAAPLDSASLAAALAAGSAHILLCCPPAARALAEPADVDLRNARTLLSLAQALAASGSRSATGRLVCLTRGCVAVTAAGDDAEHLSLSQAPMLGLTRAARAECQQAAFLTLDLPAQPASGTAQHAAQLLLSGSLSVHAELAVRGQVGAPFAPCLVCTEPPPASACPPLRRVCVVVGDGPLALMHVRFAIELLGATSVALVCGSPAPTLPALRCPVLCLQADAGDARQLALAFTSISQVTGVGVGAVIHCAATVLGDALVETTWPLLRHALMTGPVTALRVSDVACSLGCDLQLLAFSSLAVAGAAHAAMGSFGSALAARLQARRIPAVAVSWGVARPLNADALPPPLHCVHALGHLLSALRVHRTPSLAVASVAEAESPDEPDAVGAPPERSAQCVLRGQVLDAVRHALGDDDDGAALDEAAPLMSLGLTSLGAIAVHTELEQQLSRSLPGVLACPPRTRQAF